MRRFFGFILVIFLLQQVFLSPVVLFAREEVPNNKFGIHIAKPHEEDIIDAAKLVNGNGGGWGYVTMVMQEDNRDAGAWQNKFDMMRELRLIPIVRIATKPDGLNWRRPTKEEASEWAEFLHSLRWVTEDRYVIIFNEPNHATEWGGRVDPQGYAEVAVAFATALKEKSPRFRVMLAGLDASAPSRTPYFEDSGTFLRIVVETIGKDRVNQLFDAFASHSYPNPGFSQAPTRTGKGSVRSYEWELQLLSQLGVREMPVFITETGWDANAIGRVQTAQNLEYAFRNIWLPDHRVQVVTPFILNYQDEPFLKFSWRKHQSTEFYPQYTTIQQMEKVVGQPKIVENGSISFAGFPSELVEDSKYHFIITLRNTGEGFWHDENGYRLELENTDPRDYLVADLYRIRPGDSVALDFYFKTGRASALQERRFVLYNGERKVLESDVWKYKVLPLPSLKIQSKLFPKLKTTSDRFELQIFNESEELVYKRNRIRVVDGVGDIEAIRNIAYGKTYRIVLLHKGYLPRQTYVTFGLGTNEIIFERMLPFDLDGDGTISFGDIWQGITRPEELASYLP
ncbi:MAG: hypothetical protein N2691_05745 [Patescibacteria group bacterium]|nr:hypothetical protein [Patescibacteria group bacterium]